MGSEVMIALSGPASHADGSLLLPRCPGAGRTAWGLHPIGAGVVEPGVEVKLRLLDALD